MYNYFVLNLWNAPNKITMPSPTEMNTCSKSTHIRQTKCIRIKKGFIDAHGDHTLTHVVLFCVVICALLFGGLNWKMRVILYHQMQKLRKTYKLSVVHLNVYKFY